jgi:hypothetical protein
MQLILFKQLALFGTLPIATIGNIMQSDRSMCTIQFTDENQKARAFYELVHSKAQFSGIGKNTFVISRKDCKRLESKNIKYNKLD